MLLRLLLRQTSSLHAPAIAWHAPSAAWSVAAPYHLLLALLLRLSYANHTCSKRVTKANGTKCGIDGCHRPIYHSFLGADVTNRSLAATIKGPTIR
jgi:hypothetical protein